MTSCSTTSVEPEANSKKEIVEVSKKSPDWIKVSENNFLAAYGSAYKTTGGVKFQQTEATANGKEALRKKIKIKISQILQASLKTLSLKSGKVIEEDLIKNFSERIAVHVSLQSINSSEKKAVWFDEKENLYILMAIDPEIIKKLTILGTKTLLRGDKELFDLYNLNMGENILIFYLNRELLNKK